MDEMIAMMVDEDGTGVEEEAGGVTEQTADCLRKQFF